jgi:hypothetical protein
MFNVASEINDDDEQDTARERDREIRNQKSNIAYKNNNFTYNNKS